MYKFLESKNLIYDQQFGFQRKHALLHLTDKIREQLDKGNFVCGIFVDFQKAFGTGDHNILIQKLNYCGGRSTAKNWFSSHLENISSIIISG